MSKHLKLSAMYCLFACMFAVSFASTHEIGEYWNSQSHVPKHGLYQYGWSRSIYTLDELQDAGIVGAGLISSIGFDVSNSPNNYSFPFQSVYMRNTADTELGQATFNPAATHELVFEGTVTYNGSGWHDILLANEFYYDGVSGFEIVWENRSGAWSYGYPEYRSTYAWDKAIHTYQDGHFPNPGTETITGQRPNLKVEYEYLINQPVLVVEPAEIDFGRVYFGENSSYRNVSISNRGNGTLELGIADLTFTGANPDQFAFDTDVFPIALELFDSVNLPVYAIGDTAGDIAANLNITYGGITHSVALSATTMPEGVSIVQVGQGTSAQYPPFGAWYGYERSASIYMANEINEVGAIQSISWYVANSSNVSIPYKIYLGITQETSQYDLPSYFTELIADMTLVAQGSHVFNSVGWHTIELSQPFNLVGGNLHVAIETNYGGNGTSGVRPQFRYTNVGYTHQYWGRDGSVPSISSDLNGNRPNIELMFSPLPQEVLMTVSPLALDFGSLAFGATSDPMQITILNAGGVEFTLTGAHVSIDGDEAVSFYYEEGSFPLTLGSGELAQVSIYANSSIEGLNTASLTITYEDQSAEIELSANIMTEGDTEIAVGDGINSNTASSGNTPYLGIQRNFRMQNLYKAAEITAAGGVPGYINSISYHVANVNNFSPRPNYRIRIKHTNSESFNSLFDNTGFVQVFQSNTFMPNVGWNTHVFDEPFMWDGHSNIIVETVTDLASANAQNASVYYNTTGHYCTIIFTSNTQSASNANSGNVSTQRPNIKLSITMTGLPDMAALQVAGPRMPNIDTETIYRVSVRNLSPDPVEDYTVKLYDSEDELLASVAGPLIQPMETKVVDVPWIPEQLGEMQIYGAVDMPGDEFPQNNATDLFSVEVMPIGFSIIQFGYGGGTNGDTSWPTPYGSFYKAFREQHLLTVDELYANFGTPGFIFSVSYHVNLLNNCAPMPNYRIRLKHTSQTALTTTYETGDYTEVYHSDLYEPILGWNEHSFSQPFFWNGVDNLLIDIVTDMHDFTGYSRNCRVPSSTTPFNSILRYQSDNYPGTTAVTGSVDNFRPNVRVKMLRQDFGSISGVVMEGSYPVPNVAVAVQNTSFSARTNGNGEYHLPFVPVGERVITATKRGYETVSHTVNIVLNQTSVQNFAMTGTPAIGIDTMEHDFGSIYVGETVHKTINLTNSGGGELVISSIEINGSNTLTLSNLPELPITLRSDQPASFRVNFTPVYAIPASAVISITDNLGRSHSFGMGREVQSARISHHIQISGVGISEFTIGNGYSLDRNPFDFYNYSSVVQTILTNSELNGFVGQITGMRLYNDFYSDVMQQPVMIYMGRTNQQDSQNGWIPSSQMELVYDHPITFPAGEHTIELNFPRPFEFFDGGNLVILFHKLRNTNWYGSDQWFKVQTWGNTRTRKASTDGLEYDTDEMYGGTLSGTFPKMTFLTIPGGVGNLSGYVYGEEGLPLQNVNVNIGDRMATMTNDSGYFAFNSVLPGEYRLTFVRHGYEDHHYDITLQEDDEIELEIVMTQMQKVAVSGNIVASDTSEGIEGAAIYLYGYDNYAIVSSADGSFDISPGVYANFVYEYVVNALGYEPVSGVIEVGDTAYDMGGITLQELAYAPTQVQAAINPDHSSANISWVAPDPSAFEISESFESDMFPPTAWTQLITNDGIADNYGVRPTWSRFGTAEGIAPSNGAYQAGLRWIAERQNEWLMTPNFSCPQDGYLRFDTYLHAGSSAGDHYYVKVSTNDGATWDVLWDGAALPSAVNAYNEPILIDLSDYALQLIKLAWHADDGSVEMGMWHDWYIDNVYIGNFVGDRAITPTLSLRTVDEEEESRALDRGLVGYKVWRLQDGQQAYENNWVLLNDELITETEIDDPAWNSLGQGQYLWAVRAIYTADVVSSPIFSNVLIKTTTNGTISGFVRNSENNQAIAGAIVSAGDQYTATTTASGFYNISLPAGVFSISAAHEEYTQLTHDDIAVVPGENTTLNFALVPLSNEDAVEIFATALSANYPNPFNPETTISYDLKEPAHVRLDVFNLKGQLVKTLVNGSRASGRHNVIFTAYDDRGNRLSSGLYFYRLKAGDYSKTRKMMLME